MSYSSDIVPNDRFEQLKSEIDDYEAIKGNIRTGVEDYEKIRHQKKENPEIPQCDGRKL